MCVCLTDGVKNRRREGRESGAEGRENAREEGLDAPDLVGKRPLLVDARADADVCRDAGLQGTDGECVNRRARRRWEPEKGGREGAHAAHGVDGLVALLDDLHDVCVLALDACAVCRGAYSSWRGQRTSGGGKELSPRGFETNTRGARTRGRSSRGRAGTLQCTLRQRPRRPWGRGRSRPLRACRCRWSGERWGAGEWMERAGMSALRRSSGMVA